MVRKAALIALVLGSAAIGSDDNPYKEYAPQEGEIFRSPTTTGDTFHVLEKEVTRDASPNTGVTLWMRGEHINNPKVKYRTSLWKVYLNCKGGYMMLATSHLNAQDISIYEWDGYSALSSIRPGTIYETLQEKLCS